MSEDYISASHPPPPPPTQRPERSFAGTTVGDQLRWVGVGVTVAAGILVLGAAGLWAGRSFLARQAPRDAATRSIEARVGSAVAPTVAAIVMRGSVGAGVLACNAFAITPRWLATTASCIDRVERDGGSGGVVAIGSDGAARGVVRAIVDGASREAGRLGAPDVGLLEVDADMPAVATIAPREALGQLRAGDAIYLFPNAGSTQVVRGELFGLDQLDAAGRPAGVMLRYGVQATGGGPVLDANGLVVGVNVRIGSSGSGAGVTVYGVRADRLEPLLAKAAAASTGHARVDGGAPEDAGDEPAPAEDVAAGQGAPGAPGAPDARAR